MAETTTTDFPNTVTEFLQSQGCQELMSSFLSVWKVVRENVPQSLLDKIFLAITTSPITAIFLIAAVCTIGYAILNRKNIAKTILSVLKSKLQSMEVIHTELKELQSLFEKWRVQLFELMKNPGTLLNELQNIRITITPHRAVLTNLRAMIQKEEEFLQQKKQQQNPVLAFIVGPLNGADDDIQCFKNRLSVLETSFDVMLGVLDGAIEKKETTCQIDTEAKTYWGKFLLDAGITKSSIEPLAERLAEKGFNQSNMLEMTNDHVTSILTVPGEALSFKSQQEKMKLEKQERERQERERQERERQERERQEQEEKKRKEKGAKEGPAGKRKKS